jgi:2-methylcitrate dehydratase PrpD
MDITADMVVFCYSLEYHNLPPAIVDFAKYYALDFIGVACRGSLEEAAKSVFSMVSDLSPQPGPSVVIGTNIKTAAPFAALANGTSSHCVDMEDISNKASVHPGVVIFPSAFAAGEMSHCDGKRFIEAVVAGYEVICKLGIMQNPPDLYNKGFYPTGVCGAFGAAVTVSKILGLDKEQMLDALGIAGSQSAGLMEFSNSGGWSLRLNSGWPAHSGVMAALLAAKGFKGPSTIIEGKYGFLRSYMSKFDSENSSLKMGAPYEICETSIKPYAGARYMNGPVEGIIRIMKENHLKPDEVKRVVIGMLKSGWNIVVAPEEKKRNPQKISEASGSMVFGAAIAVLYGKVTPDEFTEANLRSPVVKGVMERVTCVQDPELDKLYPKQWPATVEIETQDGRKFSVRIDYPKGDHKNPLSWAELINKYDNLASSIYSKEKRNEILVRVRNLEKEKDMQDFCRLFLTETWRP